MRRMKNIHALLTQLDIFTTTLGGSKFVTISIVLPVIKSIMKVMVAKEDDPNYICEMKAVMITDFKERVKDLLDLGFLMKTVALGGKQEQKRGCVQGVGGRDGGSC